MNKYLITLTPIDKFFFGGETGFSRSVANFDDQYSSYIVKSGVFPQQTSLLGMLRFLILSNDEKVFQNNKIVDKEKAKELIGAQSFQVDASGKNARMLFGKIISISPCFILRKTENAEWEKLLFSPMDYNLERVSFDLKSISGNNKYFPRINGYDAKKGLKSGYLGSHSYLDESGLFCEDTRIGINRSLEGETKEGAYYKQIFYRFSDRYKNEDGIEEIQKQELKFAFYAEFTDDYRLPQEKGITVSLGGDGSGFVLQATKLNVDESVTLPEKYSSRHNTENCYARLVLTSDAYLNPSAMKYCMFSINETVPFRFLESKVDETTEYYRFSGKNALTRSEQKYNLYKRGSVFYFENKENLTGFEMEFKSQERFVQIGYNHFQVILNTNNSNK